jgi:hypothetical protein
MILNLDDNYRINGDITSYNLEKKSICKTTTKNQNAGDIIWTPQKYYGKLSEACKSYMNLQIATSEGIKTAKEIKDIIEKSEKSIESSIEAFQNK